jgi:hypothetical protein
MLRFVHSEYDLMAIFCRTFRRYAQHGCTLPSHSLAAIVKHMRFPFEKLWFGVGVRTYGLCVSHD